MRRGPPRVIGRYSWAGCRARYDILIAAHPGIASVPDETVRDRVDTNVTFSVKRSSRNDSIRPENIWIHNLNRDDGLIRPKVKYDVRDNLSVWAGIDYFYGSEKGTFGQFDKRDRLLLGVEIGF